MRVLTAIGEIGVSVDNRDVLFRPSLYAMSKLPEPVTTFHAIHNPQTSKLLEFDRLLAAVEVLQACCDEDISWLVGRMGSKWRAWIPGKIPPRNCIVLASALIRHGIVGVVPEDENAPPPDRSGYTKKFEPRDIVALAIAHLGLSESEAWNLTVTSFVLAMRAKFPTPKSDTPTKKESTGKMEWLAKINKARK